MMNAGMKKIETQRCQVAKVTLTLLPLSLCGKNQPSGKTH